MLTYLSLCFTLSINTPQKYHDIVHVDQTLVALAAKLLDQRNRAGAEVLRLCLGVDKLTAQTLKHALL